MPDKAITVDVPAERVPEFYAWFAAFLAGEPGEGRGGPRGGPGGRGRGRPGFGRGGPWDHEPEPWTAEDGEAAAWLYAKLAPPARALFDVLLDAPGERVKGDDLAARLGLDKGAHGVAGILAWPGRYCRKLGRALPITTDGRADGGTDYSIAPEVAEVFAAARRS